ncbi:glutamate-cysteine ligase family protein [Longimicrobium sp.]|uniref:glutamate-cysteine ligase family protein n=1 Tax=Longimicrobium sp. TaxID=2029185 RepID=UPI003B3AB571
MSRTRVIAVVSYETDGRGLPGGMHVTADRYLEGGEGLTEPGAVVVNLCRSWKYGSKGYYVSLLADARGQLPIPSVDVSEVFGDAYALFRALQEAGVATVDPEEMRARRRTARAASAGDEEAEDDEAPRAPSVPIVRVQEEDGWTCRPAEADEAAETLVFLGGAADARFRNTALAVYREWPAPVLRLQLVREEGEWKVTAVTPVPPHRLSDEDREQLCRTLADEKRIVRRGREAPREERRASIAVLVDPDDAFSPSSPETLDRLERIAQRMNVHVRRIGLDELHRLPEYDALFIRALTGVSEPAFQFTLRAEALGMPVVDDSQSIIRCGNKVFLDELLRREGIAMPRSRIVTRQTPWDEVAGLGLPLVIKLPDGSFSSAVHKVSSADEFRRYADDMFRRSPLIIAQEFLPTDYDWRITVLDGRLLFACRYHMARGHWQIRAESTAGKERYGRVEAVPREQAPEAVVQAALRAARLIGDGLYGVDLKETADGPVVIEVNDNPNLDVGYDDAADGTAIYEDLIDFFVRRIEQGPAEDEPAEAEAAETRLVERARTPIPAKATRGERHYKPFEVAGMELEYPTVDRDLNVVSLVEPAFRVLAGRGTSDVDLGAVGFSNEIADHVFEIKTQQPVRSLADAERMLAEGVQRFSAVLHAEFGARLMPTGMHPWFDPRNGKLWTRSGLRVYTTYARLFDVRTHGWMNVHAAHLNLPMGREVDAMAMHTAAALLIPYLPALAASSPMYDGDLQPAVDGRLAWILEHQARIPESCGQLVPEYVDSFGDYRKQILAPMYRALDRLPDTGAIRHEFFNTRGAILRFARRAMEVRVLDTQECVKMDVAIAVFVRAALKHLTARAAAGRVELPDHTVLVEDFRACIHAGSEARVRAPHLDVDRDADGSADARTALRHLLAGARRTVRKDEAGYLDLVARMIEAGTLSERIRAEMAPFAQADDETFTEAARRIYIELIDCLEANEPWARRGL